MLSIIIEEDKEEAVAKEATWDATAVSGLAESDDILALKDVRKTIFCLNRLWQESGLCRRARQLSPEPRHL